MRNSSLLIRITDACIRSAPIVDHVLGTIDPTNFAKLVDASDLEANPRDCKIGPITDAIKESLLDNSDLFQHKTKGLLLACKNCEHLQRNRFKLEFNDHEIEGVLDGGHNMLATATFIIEEVCKLNGTKLPKIRVWEDLVKAWDSLREDIEEHIENFTFRMPIEIKHAKPETAGEEAFETSILDISQARNNNRELAIEAKSNKAGHYDFLREALDPKISEQVEWKTNSGGRLTVRELVALATIPLSKVKAPISEISKIKPVSIYRNKGQCLKLFEDLMSNDSVTNQDGAVRVLNNAEIKSALKLMKELPRVYDWIYLNFPDYYNTVSPRFAGINSVRTYKPTEKGFDSSKHLKVMAKSRFYQKPTKYDYPEGFIAPIIWGVSELIESKDGKVQWVYDPILYLEKYLSEIMPVYFGMIQMANYDPQSVGKNTASYRLVSGLIKSHLTSLDLLSSRERTGGEV